MPPVCSAAWARSVWPTTQTPPAHRHPRPGAGEWLEFVKYTVFGQDKGATTVEVPGGGFEVAAASAAEWDKRWETSQVEVPGDPFAEQALRFAAFHLIGRAPRSSEGAGVGPASSPGTATGITSSGTPTSSWSLISR